MEGRNPSSVGRSQGAPATEHVPDLSGQTLDDFFVLRRLGQGGMGQVYLAEQISLKRKVALKILRKDLAADTVSLQRFKAEALNVARVTHANIVQVYAIGEAQGLHYMALEYVEGRNLREYLEKKGPPETLVALSIMRQVAAALQRASELEIIHRDVKPENILLTRKGQAKVADFGLSYCFNKDAQPLNLTRPGVSMGTPLYMSPEQVEGKVEGQPVDHRSDIYSFGVTCYHLFAGQPPFQGSSPFEVAIQHVQKKPVPLGQIRPDLPAELCSLVHKMMAKKPADRFQTWREIIKEIARLRDVAAGAGNPNPGVFTEPISSEAEDALITHLVASQRRRPRWFAWVVAAAVVLALAGGLLVGMVTQPKPAIIPHDAELPRELLEKRQKEAELIKLIQQNGQSQAPLEVTQGFTRALDLGFEFLKARDLDKADGFFRGLDNPKMKPQYQALGKLGQAIVLAFQDKAEESNTKFLEILRPYKQEKFEKKPGSQGWQYSMPAVREMIAEALNHNYANSPKAFPPVLEHFRHVPQPRPKAP